jgi:site-specific recombinase XerD
LIQGKKGNEYVFCKPDGRPFTEVPDVWKTIIRDLKFNEGITEPREKVVFHTLRHTFCSWLAMEGVPLHVIKELAGHKTIQMTERYAHLMPDIRKKAVEKIFNLLKK